MSILIPAKPLLSFLRSLICWFFMMLLLFAATVWPTSANRAQSVCARQEEAPQTLALRIPVECEIASGNPHTWQIPLSAGDYLRLSIVSISTNLVAELFAPGKPGRSGEKPLLSTADGNVLTFHQER